MGADASREAESQPGQATAAIVDGVMLLLMHSDGAGTAKQGRPEEDEVGGGAGAPGWRAALGVYSGSTVRRRIAHMRRVSMRGSVRERARVARDQELMRTLVRRSFLGSSAGDACSL